MKKIKISELPISNTLKGLFTIGVDALNRSVKVSLQFIEDLTNEAVSKANTAASEATISKQNADKAASDAKNAADEALKSKNQADTAAERASLAAESANRSSTQASNAAVLASQATEESNRATSQCKDATQASNEATRASIIATEESKEATQETLATIHSLIPTGLIVEQPPRITLNNVNPIFIKAHLSPQNVLKNIIYISDNKAVTVGTDGRIYPVSKGFSIIHIIPTCNTALAHTLLVEVGEPTLRLIVKNQLRFTQNGKLRLN